MESSVESATHVFYFIASFWRAVPLLATLPLGAMCLFRSPAVVQRRIGASLATPAIAASSAGLVRHMRERRRRLLRRTLSIPLRRTPSKPQLAPRCRLWRREQNRTEQDAGGRVSALPALASALFAPALGEVGDALVPPKVPGLAANAKTQAAGALGRVRGSCGSAK